MKRNKESNMKPKFIGLAVATALALPFAAGSAHAKATADEIARLGKDLNCIGAEKAGNADGSIPEWSGKWLGVPPHVDFKGTGRHPIDPYAGEKPLFEINAKNVAQYATRLSEGQKALFAKYPDTFRMPVYPTHRDFRYPDAVCESTRRNAAEAELLDGGMGVHAYTNGVMFPFPQSGLELLWNITVPYRAHTEELVSDNAYVIANGSINWGRVKSRNMGPSHKPGMIEPVGERAASWYLNETLLPERDRGEVNTGVEFYNYKKQPRQSWRYDPGTRRVRQSPGYGFDMSFPGTGGSITVDEVRIWNGSPERYDWTILGKQEIYIPFHAWRVHAPDIKYADLLMKGHANPDYMRYELRRVWVLEGKLKEGLRHLYGKRVMYIDADTMFPVMADNYDARGELWRTSMLNHFYAYEMNTWQAGAGFYHDLNAGTYLGFNLINEQPNAYRLNEDRISERDFGPEAARRIGQ
jgi:hypothetical protein